MFAGNYRYECTDEQEVIVPEEFKSLGVASKTCAPEVQELYTRIWTELQK